MGKFRVYLVNSYADERLGIALPRPRGAVPLEGVKDVRPIPYANVPVAWVTTAH